MKLKFYSVEIASFIFLLTVSALVAINSFPFSFFVDVNVLEYRDVCVGDDRQVLKSQRDVNQWFDPIRGNVFADIYRLEKQTIFETTIKRETDFLYQYEPSEFMFEIQWSEPFREVGTYGISEIIKIKPLPFVTISSTFDQFDKTFKVVDCDE